MLFDQDYLENKTSTRFPNEKVCRGVSLYLNVFHFYARVLSRQKPRLIMSASLKHCEVAVNKTLDYLKIRGYIAIILQKVV